MIQSHQADWYRQAFKMAFEFVKTQWSVWSSSKTYPAIVSTTSSMFACTATAAIRFLPIAFLSSSSRKMDALYSMVETMPCCLCSRGCHHMSTIQHHHCITCCNLTPSTVQWQHHHLSLVQSYHYLHCLFISAHLVRMWAVNQTRVQQCMIWWAFLMGAKSTPLLNLLAMGKLPKGICNKDVTWAIDNGRLHIQCPKGCQRGWCWMDYIARSVHWNCQRI